MLLKISNLHIDSFQGATRSSICRNLNFSVETGETLGILGESGSGKSITALSILKLLPPTLIISSGSIEYTHVNGSTIDLTHASDIDLQTIRGKDISMVFQEPMTSLNPVFSCGDQLIETILQHEKKDRKILGRRNYFPEAKEKVLSLFEKVRLPDPNRIFNSYPYQLSGGQKQRVMIAMAISCNPRLLIADEPTTALDVTVQRSILELLNDLQSELGMSIMFITHDISVISEIAHRILVFNKGEIVEQGDLEQVINHPKHIYTQGLMACRSSVKDKGHRLMTLENYLHEGNIDLEIDTKPSVLPQNNPILSIENLNLSFHSSAGLFGRLNRKQILHSIHFDVYENETLGLVGESGSGKTTIGRSIMRLVESESGNIRFENNIVNSLSGNALKSFRKKVQIIFQDPYSSLNPKHTIGEIITEPMVVHGLFKNARERKLRVLELLKQVNLDPGYYNRYPHQFSGGQRQRIGIARALAVEPKLLILDESVSALDVSIQAQVLNLLNDIKKLYNLTYLFISHDLNIVRYMSDRIIVLKNGAVVETGKSDDLFNFPKSQYTIELLSAIPGKKMGV